MELLKTFNRAALLNYSILFSSAIMANDSYLLELHDKAQKANAIPIKPQEEIVYMPGNLKDLNLNDSDLVKSDTAIGVIPPGTSLFNMAKNSRIEINQERIIVRFFKTKDFLGHQILLNADGSTTYKVHFEDIQHIDEITRMHEKPFKYNKVEKKLIVDTDDELFGLQSDFNFSIGLVSSNFTKDLIDDSELTMRTFHYDLILYPNWNFDIRLGALLGIETANGTSGRGFTVQDLSLMVGPAIKTKIGNYKDWPIELTASLKASIISRINISTNSESYQYRSTKQALNFGLQSYFKSEIAGNVLWGASLQRTWIKAKSDQFQVDIDRRNIYDDSILFSIGLQKDWL